MKLNLRQKVYQSPGYSADMHLSPGELEIFRSEITSQWLSVIAELHPELLSQFREVGIENYHKLSKLVQHEKLWPKGNRCLPLKSCKKIRTLPFFKVLRQEFGDFKLADVFYEDNHQLGREEIYWRLVRPDVEKDVGPLHADKWFHELTGQANRIFPRGSVTVKVWIPIFSVSGKSGLLIVPNSHLKSWRHHGEQGRGGIKPIIDEDVATIGAELIPTRPGNILIFGEGTLHGGAVNRGRQTRVSVEFTMVFPS